MFLETQVSLAPTHVCLSVGPSHFRISILSASLVALREKLKKADPNFFSILGLREIRVRPGKLWVKKVLVQRRLSRERNLKFGPKSASEVTYFGNKFISEVGHL